MTTFGRRASVLGGCAVILSAAACNAITGLDQDYQENDCVGASCQDASSADGSAADAPIDRTAPPADARGDGTGPTETGSPDVVAPNDATGAMETGVDAGVDAPSDSGLDAQPPTEAGVDSGVDASVPPTCGELRWPTMLGARIQPPNGFAGLDLSGTSDAGITKTQAEAINCALSDAGAAGLGMWSGTWGDAGQVTMTYDEVTGRYQSIALQAGYTGALDFKSADGAHTYHAAPGVPLTKDGVVYPLSWTGTLAQLDPQATEIYNALMATFAPGAAVSANCRTDKLCLEIQNDGQNNGYIGARPLHVYLVFHSQVAEPDCSTPWEIYTVHAPSWNDDAIFTQNPPQTPSRWASFDMTKSSPSAKGYAGIAWDGSATYYIPSTASAPVARFSGNTDAFTDPASWQTYPTNHAFSGGTSDYRYVYFAPSGDGAVTRYDSQSAFPLPASWATFDTATLMPAAKSFAGAVNALYAGMVVFLPATSGVLAGYNNSANFTDPTAWATLDLSTVDARLKGFHGAASVKNYVYLAPHGAGPTYPGLVARWNSSQGLVSSAFQTFDLSKLDPSMANLFAYTDAIYDGSRYVYFIPGANGANNGADLVRYDTTQDFTLPASWAFYTVYMNTTTAAWDGRYIYFSGSNSVVTRFDTTKAMNDTTAWTAYDTTQTSSGVVAFFGSAFDGRYVYFAPDTFSTLIRFDSAFPPNGAAGSAY